MTEGEKMVWAATYAAEFIKQHRDEHLHGMKMDVSSAIELACCAVEDMKHHKADMIDGWGCDSDEVRMLEEMLGSK